MPAVSLGVPLKASTKAETSATPEGGEVSLTDEAVLSVKGRQP